jgi:GABA(A) receptor-associated protein
MSSAVSNSISTFVHTLSQQKETSKFKQEHPLEDRILETQRLKIRYPDRVPVIVEKSVTSQLPDMKKHKFLVPHDLLLSQFFYCVRKQVKLSKDQTIFLFIENEMPSLSMPMSQIYKDHGNNEFLFVTYNEESTFG